MHRKGWTMLHLAATTNLVEVAKMLLKHGADANAQAKWVLHVQLLRCRVSWLLRHKAVQIGNPSAQGRQ